jgi:archaellum biogenesis ATPase FlaH
MGIIVVGDQPGSYGNDANLPDSVFVTTANPNDITGLGMRLNNYLKDGNRDSQLVVCFDSVTEMLQFADMQPVFKFLHMFVGQLRDANAIGHFHLDPGAHDDQIISRLKPLFDDAVDLTR